MELLPETAAPAEEVLDVATIAVVADMDYLKIEEIEACKTAGIVLYLARPQRSPSVKAGLFRKDNSHTTSRATIIFADGRTTAAVFQFSSS